MVTTYKYNTLFHFANCTLVLHGDIFEAILLKKHEELQGLTPKVLRPIFCSF